MKLITFYLLLLTPCILHAEWLQPARAAALQRVAARPYITRQERIAPDTMVYYWTNSAVTVSTQKVQRVLGKPARNAWRDQIEAKDREKKAILDEVRAASSKPSKKNLDDIINKHSK